jgi:arylsulfatase A-like enzyme
MLVSSEWPRLAASVLAGIGATIAATGCANDGTVTPMALARSESVPVEIAGDSRLSLTPAFPATLSYDVDVPESPQLALSIALTTRQRAARARVGFRVRVVEDGFPVTVFERSLRVEEHNQWHDVRVSLAAWAGKRVTLSLETFRTRGERSATPSWAQRVETVWGVPELHQLAAMPAPERASVIVIVVDTLRRDYLGIHGFEGDISTNLDWLALESSRFDNAFAPAPWTKPSVATLLSGLHPQVHGVRDQGGRIDRKATDTLSDDAYTLPEVFRRAGYDTAAFVGNAWLRPKYGFAQGFDHYFVDNRDPALLSRAREWLEARRREKPYFLYLHLVNVHGPYRAPESDYLALRESPSLGPDRVLTKTDPGRPRHFAATPFAHADDKNSLRAWKAKYAATVRQLDRRLGELLSELRDTGELDRAWVVFTSDHGEEFLEHGSWEHGYALCDHQLHVPLWIRAPGARFAGQRISGVVSLLDVMPTLLGASSLTIPGDVQGSDRSPWIRAAPKARSRSIAVGTGIMNRPSAHSLRTERYHLLWDASTDEVNLFDVEADPDELDDIASRDPELTTRLEQLLRIQLEQIDRAAELEVERAPISEEVRERLRGLGYLP